MIITQNYINLKMMPKITVLSGNRTLAIRNMS